MKKKLVEVYTAIDKGKESDQTACGCNCGCGPEGGKSLDLIMERFRKDYSSEFDIVQINPSDVSSDDLLLSLNRILETSGETLRLKELNRAFLLPRILPLIAGDGKIILINGVPSVEELYSALHSGRRIRQSSSCC